MNNWRNIAFQHWGSFSENTFCDRETKNPEEMIAYLTKMPILEFRKRYDFFVRFILDKLPDKGECSKENKNKRRSQLGWRISYWLTSH